MTRAEVNRVRLPGVRVGDRVSFDWFGKRIAGHVESIDGVFASVWSGLYERLYEVHLEELVPNPLRANDAD